MATNKIGRKHTQESFIISPLGDLIGFVSHTGRETFFPAGYSDNAITASTASDNSGLQLNYRNSRITVSASAGDSVVLPPAKVGMSMEVVNSAAANAIDVFPTIGEAINALSADTAISVAANKAIRFTCYVNGLWNSNLTA